jgi:hypothetical protein
MIRFVRITPPLVLILAVIGCSSKPVPVKGVVKLDGTPVEGATVTFITADGNLSASAQTEADGSFSLSTGGQPGAFPGEYKILVVKSPKVAGGENMTPDSAEYMKQMKKEHAEQVKKQGPANPGDMMKMKMMGKAVPSGGPASPVKTELPAIYASTASTPLTAKVPPENQPIEINLSKK